MTDEQVDLAEQLVLEPNTLWSRTVSVTNSARQLGKLKSIETDLHLLEQQDISFVVRSLHNIVRKEQAKSQQVKKSKQAGQYFDPFLPYEADLFVADISASHLCLLNKFNVVDHHLLLVTRDFEEQENLLNLNDLLALAACLREVDGLAFFNGGSTAGASQRHKHLQLIPFPFLPNQELLSGSPLPISPAIAGVQFAGGLGQLACFPFVHAIAKLDFSAYSNAVRAGKAMLDCYHSLLKQVGLSANSNTFKQPGAYNLLVTREWMMLVPRSQESAHGISINSLGFVGSLFVKNQTSLDLITEISPIRLLTEVAVVPCSN